MVRIDKWTLDLVNVPPQDSFSSYLNLEVRFVLQEVTLEKGHKVDFDRFKIANLYRDTDIMIAIQSYLRRQQIQVLQPEITKNLEPADLSSILGKPGVVNVKNAGKAVVHDPIISIDGSKELHPYEGYRFMQSDRARQSTMLVSEIVEKESGAEAKAKIVELIVKNNKKTLKDLVKNGIAKQSEEDKLPVTKKKTGTIKKESVEVTTKIVKTPKPAKAKSAAKKPTRSASAKSTKTQKEKQRPKSAVAKASKTQLAKDVKAKATKTAVGKKSPAKADKKEPMQLLPAVRKVATPVKVPADESTA